MSYETTNHYGFAEFDHAGATNVTLNLLMTSRQAVYLSGDFCLFYPNENKSITDVTVQKLIPVGRYDWNALVSFCGIAKTTAGLDADRFGACLQPLCLIGPRGLSE